jgi:anti-sigma B factor antagonist
VGTRIIFLAGALDLTLIGRLRVTLDEALETSDDVVVNLSEVRAVDSTGIREFLRAQARAAQMEKSFTVVSPTPAVRRLFEAADAAGLLVDLGSDVGPKSRQPVVITLGEVELPASIPR